MYGKINKNKNNILQRLRHYCMYINTYIFNQSKKTNENITTSGNTNKSNY